IARFADNGRTVFKPLIRKTFRGSRQGERIADANFFRNHSMDARRSGRTDGINSINRLALAMVFPVSSVVTSREGVGYGEVRYARVAQRLGFKRPRTAHARQSSRGIVAHFPRVSYRAAFRIAQAGR